MAELALSEAEWQTLILAEVDPDGTEEAATLYDLYWRGNLRWGAVSVELRALLTEQQLLRFVLRRYASKRDWTAAGVTQKDSQVFDHLKELMAGLDARIAVIRLGLASQLGSGAIGPILQVTPVQVEPGAGLDPNSRALRGDPLERFPRGWPDGTLP